MYFSAEQEETLMDEIAEMDDALACYIQLIDANTHDVVGTASVELWVMIEDSVNILRHVSNMQLSGIYDLH